MASVDDEAASVLKYIPDDGATIPHLATVIGLDPARVGAAVKRLINLKLVEMSGETVHITRFAQKARSVFNITA